MKMALRCYKLLLWKRRFDIGYSTTGYVKYLIAFLGVGAAIQDVPLIYIAMAGLGYGFFCLLIGWIWIRFGLLDTEIEITNQYDPLANQLRGKFRLAKDLNNRSTE